MAEVNDSSECGARLCFTPKTYEARTVSLPFEPEGHPGQGGAYHSG